MPPTTDGNELDGTMRESVATLVEGLPAPVRDFVVSDKPGQVVLELSRKYQMHADQADKFHQALLFMLLGVYDPDKFVDKLSEVGLSQETIQGVLTDLNRLVFEPIKQKEVATVPQVVPRPPVAPVPAPLSDALPIEPAAPIIAPPPMRTMANDIESMSPGGAPQPAAPVAPTPLPAPEAPKPTVAPLPPQWSAPVAAPKDVPAFDKTFARPLASAGRPESTTPDLNEVHNTLKKYGIDPYREAPE